MNVAIAEVQGVTDNMDNVLGPYIFINVCGKGTATGFNVSHSHLKTKRTWKPNIQRVRVLVDGQVKRMNVCTRCLRSHKVNRDI